MLYSAQTLLCVLVFNAESSRSSKGPPPPTHTLPLPAFVYARQQMAAIIALTWQSSGRHPVSLPLNTQHSTPLSGWGTLGGKTNVCVNVCTGCVCVCFGTWPFCCK